MAQNGRRVHARRHGDVISWRRRARRSDLRRLQSPRWQRKESYEIAGRRPTGGPMKRGYADTPEGQIHYAAGGAGTPLRPLPKTGSSRQYGKLLPLLAEKYRTFAPDNLGS